MKRVLLIAVIASSVLFAAEDANTTQVSNPTRMKTMQALEVAMSGIEKGFLYNNEDIIVNGIKELKKNLQDIGSFKIVNEKDKTFNAKAYAITETGSITKLANEMETAYKAGKKDEALAAYAKTLSRCVVCHKVIRKW